MLSKPLIQPWLSGTIGQTVYDVFIACVGYESRASYIAKHLHPKASCRLACAFPDRKTHSYQDNIAWYGRSGYKVEEVPDEEYSSWCRRALASVPRTGRRLEVCVDISSMSRLRLASIVESMCELAENSEVAVDFAYSFARFSPPPKEEGPIVKAGPVLSAFAGWPKESDQASVAVFGLGYEYEKALGVLEYLEPSQVWAFRPVGHDERYTKALERANKSLWEDLPPENVLEYQYDRPFDLFMSVEALVFGLLSATRPILIPFGPKIFALVSLLVGCVYYPHVPVWRVSSGEFDEPRNRYANGTVVGLRGVFGHKPDKPSCDLPRSEIMQPPKS